jgi:hypothetical protein
MEFPEGSLKRRLAVVDPALRHLPSRSRIVDTLPAKDPPFAIYQHKADARPIGQ